VGEQDRPPAHALVPAKDDIWTAFIGSVTQLDCVLLGNEMDLTNQNHLEIRLENLLKSLIDYDKHIEWDWELLEKGFVASIHILHIIAFMEEQYKIEIDPFEIRPDIFESINSMAEFVREKLQA
jgi:hypothetical protein